MISKRSGYVWILVWDLSECCLNFVCAWVWVYSEFCSGTEKVPQRTFATKISPNFRVNFPARFASRPLFYWVVPSNCSENCKAVIAKLRKSLFSTSIPEDFRGTPGNFEETPNLWTFCWFWAWFSWQCKNLMYWKNGVVYKLHAGWFINRTPGELVNCGLFIKFKGLLCGNHTERGESLKLNFWPPGSLQIHLRHHDCLPQVRGFRTGKNTIHQVFALSIFLHFERFLSFAWDFRGQEAVMQFASYF